MNRDQLQLSVDALLALAVTEAEARELAKLPSLEEMNAAFHPSQEFGRRVAKAIQQTERKSTRDKLRHYGKRAAVTMAASLALFSCALLPVKAVREAVVETLIEWYDEFASIVFSSKDATSAQLPGKVALTYLPEGYALQDEVYFGASYFRTKYINGATNYFLLSVTGLNDNYGVGTDNESSQYYALEFDGNHAIWTVREDKTNLLVWNDSRLVYKITGNLDVAEMLHIARGIKFF